jgi:hypothetical protein
MTNFGAWADDDEHEEEEGDQANEKENEEDEDDGEGEGDGEDEDEDEDEDDIIDGCCVLDVNISGLETSGPRRIRTDFRPYCKVIQQGC